jgi:predicted nucleotide-binding protein
VYNLVVSGQFDEWEGVVFRFDKSRFLEYTDEPLRLQLHHLSIEAVECLKSWPCVLMQEGRAEEVVRIARIVELREHTMELRVSVEVLPCEPPIQNAQIWRLREALDIEQFEFSRNHWAVKDRNLFSVLHSAGMAVNSTSNQAFKEVSPAIPNRQALLEARDKISEWEHTRIDDLLLELGVPEMSAGRELGSRRNRANAIVHYALSNPNALTAEKALLSARLVRATSAGARVVAEASVSRPSDSEPPIPAARAHGENRSPNRVFIVHGRNEAARVSVVSYLESLGLFGVVLHEQPNMGRHLLTKLIQEAELVTFAVVIMTDDDVGAARDEKLQPRARQNVILELGYFIAHLGQERVCALITPGLETPSDFDGIVYIRMDDQKRWQQELRRELLAAKLPITNAGQ